MNIESQNRKVLRELQSGPKTSAYFVYKKRIPRAAARVYDLRQKGYRIASVVETINGKVKCTYALKGK